MDSHIESNHIKVNDIDVHYYAAGEGAPLIIVHGGSEGARAWIENVAKLSEHYRVYAPDMPGFGSSEPISGNYCVPPLVEFIDQFSACLGLSKFHLVGHSFGGSVAINYALKFPQKVAKLVLVNSLSLGQEIAFWMRISSLLPGEIMGLAVSSVLRSIEWLCKKVLLINIEFSITETALTFSLGSQIASLKAQRDVLLDRLGEIMMPTLIIWGAKDPLLPLKQAYTAAGLIPDCTLEVFPESGHSVYRDELGAFSRQVTRFLK